MWSLSRLIFYMDSRLFQHHILIRPSSLHRAAFAPLSEMSWIYLYGLVFAFSFTFIDLCVCSSATRHLDNCGLFSFFFFLHNCGFTVSLKSGRVGLPTFSFSLSIVLTTLGLSPFCVNFRISSSILTKCLAVILTGEAIDEVEKNWHLNNIMFSNQWTLTISPFT